MEVLNQQDVTKLAASSHHSMALLADGTLMAWGSGQLGGLGLGEELSTNYPSLVPDMTNVVDIALGLLFSLALKDNGEVWGWEYSRYGQIGENGVGIDQVTGNDIIYRTVPVKVKGLQNIIAISSGNLYSLALDSNGDVWAWGLNSANYLGVGSTDDYVFTPKKVLGLSDIVEISVGEDSSMALRSDGRILAWGANNFGQLGIGTTSPASSPTMIGALENIKSVVSTEDRSFAFDINGNLWAWGKNTYGGLGDGTKISRNTPVKLAISDVISISGDEDSTVAIKKDGSVWTWGRNSTGDLGINDTDLNNGYLTPQQVLDSSLDFLYVGVSTEDEDNTENNDTTWTTGEYANDQDISKVLSIPGASSLTVTVSGVTEDTYDFFYIYDANGSEIKKLDGSINESFTVNGSSITARLISDNVETRSGVTVSIVANDGTTSDPVINSGDCVATYSSEGVLNIPCVSVPDFFGGTALYQAGLKRVSRASSLAFEFTGAQQIDNTSSNSDECLASYKGDGSLYIPCVSVPDAFGGTTMYQADLKWDLLSTPSIFELTGAQQKN